MAAPAKMYLSHTLKTILRENNENLALFFVTPTNTIVT